MSTRGLAPNYNQATIIRAMPAVLKAVPETCLIIKYHEALPDQLTRLRALVDELNLEKFIRFVGATPYADMPKYYALADVFVSIASSDSTPVSLLEAMACGAIPVVSDLPGPGEWITSGVNGLRVRAGDAHGFKRCADSIAPFPGFAPAIRADQSRFD